MLLQEAASAFSGEKDRNLMIVALLKNRKSRARRRTHRPMDIGPSINTAIIHPVQFITGYRAKHQYRYYPSRSVYYDSGRGLYFYLKGDNWEVGASLPGSLRLGLGDSVSIELDTDKPYIHHAEHVKKYPSKQFKQKKKGKGKRS
jgi:hypothetical protein